MRVFLIMRRIPHHAEHSGYDLLARHVTARPYQDGALYRLTARIGSRRLARFRACSTPWYSVESLRREIAICARASLWPGRTVFHWLYAENDLRISPSWRWRWNNRFVASFHQPPEFLDGHVEDKSYIRGLDAVVVVAASQVDFFSRLLPRERIHLVPHGVDTEHWRPDPTVPRHMEPTFLFVGAWLRDMELTKATILACRDHGLPARFRIVTARERTAEFEGLPRTQVMTGIGDAQLLEEYRRAHALFLPLKMATANNAMLEAMSCGTGVISTRTGGTPEYVGPDCGELVAPGDVAGAVAAIRLVCSRREHTEAIGAAARSRAERFSWTKVGAMQDEAYARIAAARAAAPAGA